MLNFLFWNLKNNKLQNNILNLARRYDIDILMFAECTITANDLLNTLNDGKHLPYYYSPLSGCDKISIFTRFSAKYIEPVRETLHLTIRRLNLPGINELLLCIVHNISKCNFNDVSQSFECIGLREEIEKAETIVGHNRTILLGDFNMNPFESGLVSAKALNAVMSRHIAKKRTKTIQGKKYLFFYNPMWNFLGDYKPEPPGTFYYNVSEHFGYYWNVYDQVLIRPELLDYFKDDDIKILTSDGSSTFLNRHGVPDSSNISDHLPLFMKLNI